MGQAGPPFRARTAGLAGRAPTQTQWNPSGKRHGREKKKKGAAKKKNLVAGRAQKPSIQVPPARGAAAPRPPKAVVVFR